MLNRPELLAKIKKALELRRVVALMGPRQCGKTTLARHIVPPDSPNYFDLEDPRHAARLDEPMTALESLTGTVVIDEIQRRPQIFPILRVLADRNPLPAKFLILGSASPGLIKHSSESLAGRMTQVTMGGFDLAEVGAANRDTLWLRGGFPESYLSKTDQESSHWRRDFIRTFLERDVPQLGIHIPADTLQRFWTMIAHYHGGVWKTSEPAQSMGVGERAIRSYLDLLTGAFMIRRLEPWHANLRKRQVKAPKVYFRDTGLLHELLGIRSREELMNHPRSGASWEGFVIENILRATDPEEAYFWATHQGAEIDLLIHKGGRMYGIECKRADAPRMTPSMHIAMNDLELERIAVIYPGAQRYMLAARIEVVPLAAVAEGMAALFPKSAN